MLTLLSLTGTCPYVSAIGGTQGLDPEIAWDGSTGGFSNYFPRAWYQEAAIETYLGSYISESVQEYYTPYTNFSGRGFPDFSAHSSNPYWPVFANVSNPSPMKYNGRPILTNI